jgi:ABC-type multidrug transport system fused ATPase/permease subunit
VKKTKEFELGPRGLVRLLVPLVHGHWRYVGIVFAVVLFTAIIEGIGFSLVIPLLQTMLSPGGEIGARGNVLLRIFSEANAIVSPEWRLGALLGLLAVVFLFKSIGLVAAGALTRWFSDTLRMNWATRAYLASMNAPYSQMATRPHGEIVHNILGETEGASRGVLLLIEFSARFIQITVLFILLFLTSWQATLFILSLGAAAFLLSWRPARRFSVHTGKARQAIQHELHDIVTETMAALRTAKLLDIAAVRAKRLRQMFRSYRQVDTKFEIVSSLPSNAIDLIAIIVGAGIIAFMTFGLGLRIEDVVPITALFGLVFLRLAGVASRLFAKQLNIVSSLLSLRTVHELVTMNSEHLSGSIPFPGFRSDIVLENIVLRPPGRASIFDGLCMTIAPRGLAAIVGPSGSGKTTLVDLIVRLREPDGGRVLINGRDIKEFDVRSLRARVGYLSQEPQLFNGTVAENILLGRPDATNGEMRTAAERAHVHDFVSAMPEGYATPLGRGAVTLSGGQRQRLALARELLRNPDLYIFDEPTSALDRESEAVIGELINELSKTRPVIIISHRMDVIVEASVIYQIEHGKAVELSSPEFFSVSSGARGP